MSETSMVLKLLIYAGIFWISIFYLLVFLLFWRFFLRKPLRVLNKGRIYFANVFNFSCWFPKRTPVYEFVKEINHPNRMRRFFVLKVKCDRWHYQEQAEYRSKMRAIWDNINTGRKRAFVFEDLDEEVGGIYQCFIELVLHEECLWFINGYGLDISDCSLKKFRTLIDTVEVGLLKAPVLIEIRKNDIERMVFFRQYGFRPVYPPTDQSMNSDRIVFYRPSDLVKEEHIRMF